MLTYLYVNKLLSVNFNQIWKLIEPKGFHQRTDSARMPLYDLNPFFVSYRNQPIIIYQDVWYFHASWQRYIPVCVILFCLLRHKTEFIKVVERNQ